MKKVFLKIIHGIAYFFYIGVYFFLFPFVVLFTRHLKTWLISEIDFDARDNGIYFFKYLSINQPHINSVYIISKKHKDYNSIQKIGKTVEPGSFKHLVLFISAETLISTIVNGCAPNKYYLKFFRRHHPIYGKCINLKHGIYKDFSINDTKQIAKCDLVICGGLPEYKYILSNYGYSDNEVAYTGLARFDGLVAKKPTNTIMIMPTWRRWLDGMSDDDFKETMFFKSWSSLLDALIKNTNLRNYNFTFFVHPKMNAHLSLFATISQRVSFMSTLDSNMQEQIVSSSLLITDYSSIFFDFAYLQKPIIYYQFDVEDFFARHYKKTYFDYERDGFGDVCFSKESAVDSLERSLKQKNDLYTKRSLQFFKLHDNKNCERIYHAILRSLDGK